MGEGTSGAPALGSWLGGRDSSWCCCQSSCHHQQQPISSHWPMCPGCKIAQLHLYWIYRYPTELLHTSFLGWYTAHCICPYPLQNIEPYPRWQGVWAFFDEEGGILIFLLIFFVQAYLMCNKIILHMLELYILYIPVFFENLVTLVID